ncbi:MAG: glycosyltransferase [Synechococcus sp. SB0662_bin_45]|nr:glycosyltransferase [Synechococcus sp. SB0668_bin_13]MYE21713.1 glycosyltransferase [Synechococcus sp. SB0662_bin_45]
MHAVSRSGAVTTAVVKAPATGSPERPTTGAPQTEATRFRRSGTVLFSVVIPTYNRLPILRRCLAALEAQDLSTAPEVEGYEVVVVDDGSTDETVAVLHRAAYPHLHLLQQDHGGAAMARNRGVKAARGNVIVFIDSDLVVVKGFLAAHARALQRHWRRHGNRLCFTYGAVINTSNFAQPTTEPCKLTDLSWAYFATGNVAIDRQLLLRSGLFDTRFRQYGWEDLELGERLRQLDVVLVRCPEAIGYHWHPPFRVRQVQQLVQREQERARMAWVFYRKHPTLRVRMIIQFTWLHLLLWQALTLGGLLNAHTMGPLLAVLVRRGRPGWALELLRLHLNRVYVQAVFAEAQHQRRQTPQPS